MKYMIRKPDYIKYAAYSKYFPNTAITLLIGLAIFGVLFVVSLIIGSIYASANMGSILRGDFDINAFKQTIMVISLYSEALLIACTLIHTRAIEKRPLYTLGLVRRKFVPKYLVGFGAGAVLLALTTLPAFFAMKPVFIGINATALVYLGAFMVQSAAEEFVFRGYIMTSLLRRRGALWAVVVSTVAFGLFHIPGSSITPLQLLGVTLLGAVLALYALRTENLWGAMGLHAAWNFFLACLAPLSLGPFNVGYAFFEFGDITADILLLDVLQLLLLIAAIALLLFVGKRRLVVRRPAEQAELDEALHILRLTAGKDSEAINRAMRVSALACSQEGKVAALLHYSVSYGREGEIKAKFGEQAFAAAEAMFTRFQESPVEYWRRVMQYPAAMDALAAESRLDEIKRPKHAGAPALDSKGLQCPMMRWNISPDFCRRASYIVDGGEAGEDEDFIAALDHGLCRTCRMRQQYNATPLKGYTVNQSN